MNKDSQESKDYRAAFRESYLDSKRKEIIKEWIKRDRAIYWDITKKQN